MRVFIAKHANGAELPVSKIKELPVIGEEEDKMYLFGNTIAVQIGDGFTDERREHCTTTDGKTYRLIFNYPMGVIDDNDWDELDV